MSLSLIKRGNAKIHKSCNVFNLPTYVCGLECSGCYAKKAETRFPKVLESRQKNYLGTLHQLSFIANMHNDIVASKNKKMRIHESGDFYSQDYIGSWQNIVSHLPHVQFYAYTKKMNELDFSEISKLQNINIINSITPLGYNYGKQAYVDRLVSEYGYILCPCKKGVHVDCMKDCEICLTNDKVCFLQH